MPNESKCLEAKISRKYMERLNSISDFHRFTGQSSPEHPLISLIDYSKVTHQSSSGELKWVQTFYTISLKRDVVGKYRYGQQTYDFDEGLMNFFAPNQVITIEQGEASDKKPSGWILAIHPDFFFGSELSKKIKKYQFLNYSVREALFLSEKEEKVITTILSNIQSEYQANLDQFSQEIILNQIELLLNYADRFYQRQFLTRKVSNHELLDRFEKILEEEFEEQKILENGLPNVQQIASRLHVSPDYLSSMLKVQTGQSTQQHLHRFIIDAAKVQLSTSQLSVSQISYALGFEHPQSFSKLFKSKTNQTPLEYRASFN